MDLPQSSHRLIFARLLSASECSLRSPNRLSLSSFFQTMSSFLLLLLLIVKAKSCSIRSCATFRLSSVNPASIRSRSSDFIRTNPAPVSVSTVETSPLALDLMHFFSASSWALIRFAPCAVLYHNLINQRRNL